MSERKRGRGNGGGGGASGPDCGQRSGADASLPAHRRGPLQIQRIQRERLCPPAGQDFWVFGYGSLIWHPGFPHIEVRPGLLRGYHRRFCLYSHRYRGTPERPGLVLGLDRGGSCRGLVFRVPSGECDAAMDYLYEREMLTGAYNPGFKKVETRDGPVRAICFIVDRRHNQYAGALDDEETAALICQGRGQKGTGHEYLRNTVHHLDALDLSCPRLRALLRLVEARSGLASDAGE